MRGAKKIWNGGGDDMLNIDQGSSPLSDRTWDVDQHEGTLVNDLIATSQNRIHIPVSYTHLTLPTKA